jgi:cytochrome c553
LEAVINTLKRLSIFILILTLAACALRKEIAYSMPEGLNENQQKKFLENFNQGATVYTVSCASCHNKKEGNKIIEPQFTEKQLELYIIRIQNDEHSKKLSIRDVSDEDLQKVMFYLKYKIKK